MKLEELADVFKVGYRFIARPVPIPGDLRPMWRFSSLCLMLQNCRGNSATLRQLHVLNWALRDEQHRRLFLSTLLDTPPMLPIVRIESSLNRAVDLAIGERLIGRSGVRLRLEERGVEFAKRLTSEKAILTEEKAFFASIGRKVTSAMIDRILQWNSLL